MMDSEVDTRTQMYTGELIFRVIATPQCDRASFCNHGSRAR